MKLLYALLFLGIIVFVHEFGHFLAAKYYGVGCRILSLGFGRRVTGFHWRGTDYRISLVPFGGYVLLQGADAYGMEQELDDEGMPINEASSLQRKPVWKRLAIYAAGPAANLVLPYLLFVALISAGEPQPAALVGLVLANSPSAEVGFLAGDRIVTVGGRSVETWSEIQDLVSEPGPDVSTLAFGVMRQGNLLTLQLPLLPEAEYLGHDYGLYWDLPGNRAGVDDPRSPAGRAGLQTGDTIVEVDGVPVSDWWGVWFRLAQAGDRAEVAYLRDGRRFTATLKIDGDWKPPADSVEPETARFGLYTGTLFVANLGNDDTPAKEAGFEAGDHILAFDGHVASSWYEVLDFTARTEIIPGEEGRARAVVVTIRRLGADLQVPVTPAIVRDKDGYGRPYFRPVIGLIRLGEMTSGSLVRKRYPVTRAVVMAGEETVDLVRTTVVQIGRVLTGEVAPQDTLGGPVEIVRQASQAAERGLFDFARLMGMISISVGVFNLLPVPILDGGHLLFYAIEAIRGRPVSIAFRERAQIVGVMMLFALMLFVLVVDVQRWVVGG